LLAEIMRIVDPGILNSFEVMAERRSFATNSWRRAATRRVCDTFSAKSVGNSAIFRPPAL
jgi:hypothetical protein